MPEAPKPEIRTGPEKVNTALNAAARNEAGAGLSGLKAEAARRANEQMRSGKTRESLKTIAGRYLRSEDSESIVAAMIQTDTDPNGNKIARRGEAQRMKDVQATTKALEAYTKDGFDNLTPDQQQALRNKMGALINSIPAYQDAYGKYLPEGFGKSVVSPTIDALLREEGVRMKLADGLNQLYNPDNLTKIAELDANVHAAKTRREALGAEVKDLEDKRNKIRDAAKSRETFDRDQVRDKNGKLKYGGMTCKEAQQVYGSRLGNSGREGFNTFDKNLRDRDRLVQQLKKSKDLTDDQRRDLVKQCRDVNRWINDAKADKELGEVCTSYEEIYKKDIKIAKYEDLAFANKLPEADKAYEAKNAELVAAQKKYDDLLVERERGSAQFSNSVESALADATQEYLEEFTVDFITNQRLIEQNLPGEAVEKYQDQMIKALDHRWTEPYTKKHLRVGPFGRQDETKTRFKNDTIASDRKIFAEGGPDAVIEAGLKDAKVPPEQIEAMMKNQEFMDLQRAEVTGKLLAAHVGSGGKLEDQEIYALASTSYGEKALQALINRNTIGKDAIDRAKEAGFYKEDGRWDWDKMKKAGFASLLAFIFGPLLLAGGLGADIIANK